MEDERRPGSDLEVAERLRRAEDLYAEELRKADDAETRAAAAGGSAKSRLEAAARMHRRAAEVHAVAVRLHRLHQEHMADHEERSTRPGGGDAPQM